MWETDGLGTYIMKKNSKCICALRIKASAEYLTYVGIKVFGTKDIFENWYNTKNYWYGNNSPCDMTYQEAIDWLMRIIHGTPV